MGPKKKNSPSRKGDGGSNQPSAPSDEGSPGNRDRGQPSPRRVPPRQDDDSDDAISARREGKTEEGEPGFIPAVTATPHGSESGTTPSTAEVPSTPSSQVNEDSVANDGRSDDGSNLEDEVENSSRGKDPRSWMLRS